MTPEQKLVEEIESSILQLYERDRIVVDVIVRTLREMVKATPLATIAIALVGAEIAARTD